MPLRFIGKRRLLIESQNRRRRPLFTCAAKEQRFRTFGIGPKNVHLGWETNEPLCVQIFHQLILTKGVNAAADTRSEKPPIRLDALRIGNWRTEEEKEAAKVVTKFGSILLAACICYFGHELAAARRITLYCRLTLISKQGFVAKIEFASFKRRGSKLY